MAGRDISVTHEALGAVRVMRTCGMMGEVVGLAASLCKKHNTTPRGVYEDHLDKLKELMIGEEKAEWFKNAGRNLALDAAVSVSSNYDADKYPKENINDGHISTRDNSLRWVSSASDMPDYITFKWSQLQTIGAVRIISGYSRMGQAADPITQFKLQRYTDGGWKDIEDTRVTRRGRAELVSAFKPVHSDRIRLVVTGTPGNISRVWEVEFYNPVD
jgi:hypothetical protein